MVSGWSQKVICRFQLSLKADKKKFCKCFVSKCAALQSFTGALNSSCTLPAHPVAIPSPPETLQWAEQHISILSRNSFTQNDLPSSGISIAKNLCVACIFRSKEQVTNSTNKGHWWALFLLNSSFNSLLFLFCMRQSLAPPTPEPLHRKMHSDSAGLTELTGNPMIPCMIRLSIWQT